MNYIASISYIALTVGLISNSAAAVAQSATTAAEQQSASSDDEIVVTARKQDETQISVPVVMTVVSSETLTRQGVTNLDGLSRIVPQLKIGESAGALQGGTLSLRGIAGPELNPFGDQAISFNIDGVQVAKSSVRRMSDYDMDIVEVLKGPQALFFGKNSPGGVVSIRTADPTSSLEAGASVGYEFNAHEIRGEGYISGPISDTLGFRLAGTISDARGALRDRTPAGPYKLDDDFAPNQSNFGVRGTLKWEPSVAYDARLKVNYGQSRQNGLNATLQVISCPDGFWQSGSGINLCSAGDEVVVSSYGTVMATIPSTNNFFRADGSPYADFNQALAGLEQNFRPNDSLTLTSVTGFFDTKMQYCNNWQNDVAILLPGCGLIENREFSQELRVLTSYDGPINFSAGTYFADTDASIGNTAYAFRANGFLFPANALGAGSPNLGSVQSPLALNNYFMRQKGQAYSAFLQMIYKPVEVIEIALGGRYSYERKRLPNVRTGGGLSDGRFTVIGILDETTEVPSTILADRNLSWSDFSPEATVSFRPSGDLTVFASYKRGFLSGGFNSGSTTFRGPVLNLSYDPQTIKGFEGGVKAALFDRSLRLNVAAYSYRVSDQQVSTTINAVNSIRNAGTATVEGVEVDFSYRPPVEGLTLTGAAAYNIAEYTSFPNAPCFAGQRAGTAKGLCNAGSQDLAGTELPQAPEWNLSSTANYETQLGSQLTLGISGGVSYSSSYLTDTTAAPNGRQPSYTLVDGSIRIGDDQDRWELAFIGRNLTNTYYFTTSTAVPFARSPNGNLTDRRASVSRGRELVLRVSYRFGG